ncbi:MAG: hypothetical protein V3T23_01550 [Nitrososphaerales archaeon]
MKRPTRICDKSNQVQSFTEKLEERARKVFAAPGKKIGHFSQSSFFEDAIALTLDHIERLRSREQDITQSLLQAECYVETELMQMEQRTPRYSPYRFPEREKMQRSLIRIAEERRRFSIAHAEKLDGLHDLLLSLLNKHRQLTHEVRRDRALTASIGP